MSENNDAKKFYDLDKKFVNNYIAGGDNLNEKRVSPPKVN